MKRGMLVGLSLLVLAMGLSEVFGNLGPQPGDKGWPPKQGNFPAPANEVKLVVQVDEKAKSPRLQVPFNLMFGQPGANPFGVPPKRGADAGRLGTPTIVAGLALTLAFASGGLWLVRRGSGRYVAMLFVLALFAVGTAFVWADLGPRPIGKRPPPRPAPAAVLPALKLPAGIELTDKLVLEFVGNGDHLTLIVPKKMVLQKDKIAAPKPKRDE